MKIFIPLFLSLSFPVLAHFDGLWSSNKVKVSSSVGGYENCVSEFEIFQNERHLSFTPNIEIFCNGVKLNLKTLSFEIAEGGVLEGRMGRGKITPDSIQIFSPVKYPDGRVVESISEMKLNHDRSMSSYYLIQMASGFKIEVKGRFESKIIQ